MICCYKLNYNKKFQIKIIVEKNLQRKLCNLGNFPQKRLSLKLEKKAFSKNDCLF